MLWCICGQYSYMPSCGWTERVGARRQKLKNKQLSEFFPITSPLLFQHWRVRGKLVRKEADCLLNVIRAWKISDSCQLLVRTTVPVYIPFLNRLLVALSSERLSEYTKSHLGRIGGCNTLNLVGTMPVLVPFKVYANSIDVDIAF